MRLIVQVLIFIGMIGNLTLSDSKEYRIGVLAKRGAAKVVEQWSPTAEYLTKHLSHPFVVVPLDFDEVDAAVLNMRIDFIIANPAYYIDMENKYGISPIATLKNRHVGGKSYKSFGGVIFTKRERNDITTLNDLRGKRFAAVDSNSLGGWHVSWDVMHDSGIDPENDFSLLKFSGTHDNVVMDVLQGKVDAGCVRTDTLERMVLEGKISMKSLKIIHPLVSEDFDFVRSTPLYPEWPIAKLKHVPDRTAEEVAIALISMRSDEPAAVASQIYGWTIPANYQKVHDVLKKLKIGPYRFLRDIPISEVFREYRYYIIALFVSIIFLNVVFFIILRLNRQLKVAMAKLKEEVYLKDQAKKDLDLRSDDLIRAYEKLKELDRLKTMFIASMSHELRTPLNSIIGFTDVVLNRMAGEINEKQEEYLTRASHSGKHLLRLICDIIDISKIEAGQIAPDIGTFELREVVEDVMEQMEALIKEKPLSLVDEMTDTIVMHTDKRLLKQVLINFLSNAIKYSESGDIILSVTQPHEGWVMIKICDHGIGIRTEDTPNLFKPFERFESHLKVIAGGSGLGLYLSKKITEELLNGKIGFSSEYGTGSCFWLQIPMALAPTQEGGIERERKLISKVPFH